MHQRSSGLDDAFVKQLGLRICAPFPGIFPGLMGMPELALIKEANSMQIVRWIGHCGLVAWYARIDITRPGIDATFDVCEILEASSTERHADLRRATAVVTHDHNLLVARKVLPPGLDLAHRQLVCCIDMSDLVFIGLS